MGPIGDEGRGKLRKAAGIGKHESIRGYSNGASYLAEGQVSGAIRRRTGRTETSKYPQEKKTIVIPRVAASERGLAQTHPVTAGWGL